MLLARLFPSLFKIPLALLLLVSKSEAQNSVVSGPLRDSAISHITGMYHQVVGKESNLYNGRERSLYNFPFLGSNPNFKELSFIPGSVYYDQALYTAVPLLYDVVRDEVIVLYYDQVHQVNLVKEKVGWFTLNEHRFVHILPGSSTNLKPGFYEELYKGEVSLLMRHHKALSEKIDNGAIYSVTSEASVVYLFKNGVYSPVKNRKVLLQLLDDKRAELNKYMRQNKIKFKEHPERAMTLVIAHYDQLNK